MNKNDILALVRKGQSIDAIAEEFAQALNEAQKQLEKERSDAARKAELARAANKAAEAMNEYFKLRYPDQTFELLTGELIDLIADNIMFGFDKPIDYSNKEKPRHTNKVDKTDKEEEDLCDLIASFLALFDKPDRK